MPTRAATLVLALVVLLGAAGSSAGVTSSLTERGQATTSTTAGVGLVDWQEDQLLAERGGHLRYVVVRDVRPKTREGLRDLVRANPGTRVLLYTNAGFMIHQRGDPQACDYWPFNGDGADYCWARKKREKWFLHSNASTGKLKGRRLRSDGYRSSWAADVGDRGYRREWIRNTLKRLRGKRAGGTRVKVAGVFMDDLNLRPGHGLEGRIAEYTDAEYGVAAAGFARRVAARFDRAGFLTVANVGIDVHDPVQRSELLALAPALDAVNREYFVRYGAGDSLFTTPADDNGNDWLTELELFEATQAAGGAYLAIAYGNAPRRGPELVAARYARATFLLGWDGRSASALAFRTEDGSNPSSHSAWRTEIGTPLEPRARVGERQVWTRRYTGGIAIANADPFQSQTVWLPELYRDENGLCTLLVGLEPASGRVLSRC